MQYSGGIRQDIPNKKIYEIDLSGIEHDISVSQHLVVGDTFPTMSSDTISSIDSVLIGNKYHKQYHYQSSMDGGTYIVGVGKAGDYYDTGGDNLMCFSVDKIILLGGNNSTYPCPALISVNEEKINENNILILPNPSAGIFILKTSETNSQLSITNILGEKIYETKIIAEETKINLENSNNGIYFLTLKNKNGAITKKLVKN